MAEISVDSQLSVKDVKRDLERQVDLVMQRIIKNDLHAILSAEQQKGFPKDRSDYNLLVRSGGRESRRNIATLHSKYLKLGSKRAPLTFRFVTDSTSFEDMVEAALQVWRTAMRGAPRDSGYFRGQLSFYLKSAAGWRIILLQQLREYKFKDGDRIYVGAPTEYSAILEHGFYTKYYKTNPRPGGIMLQAVRKVRRTSLGRSLAMRFAYFEYNGGTVPFVEIGGLGQFASQDVLPGSSRRKRNRKRRRR